VSGAATASALGFKSTIGWLAAAALWPIPLTVALVLCLSVFVINAALLYFAFGGTSAWRKSIDFIESFVLAPNLFGKSDFTLYDDHR